MWNTDREEILLLKSSNEYMKEKIDNIESLLKDFIKSADTKFATKEEHRQNKEDIEKINKIFFWLWTLVIGAIILAILNLVVIWK